VADRQRHDQREANRGAGEEVQQQRRLTVAPAVEGEDLAGRRDLATELDLGAEVAGADNGGAAAFEGGFGRPLE
jgi:hypothetical protein